MEIGGRFPESEEVFGDGAIADVVASMHASIDELMKLHIEATNDGVLDLVPDLEVLARRTRSLQAGVLTTVERRGLNDRDGHGSPRILERHACKLSGTESAARHKTRRMLNHLSEVAEAYWAGEIPTAHVDLLGRVFANVRVREHMDERQSRFVADAKRLSYRQFEIEVHTWARLMDQDGPEPERDRGHQGRDAHLAQDFNGSWWLKGRFGPLQGAKLKEIFDRYLETELLADWDEAKRLHGDHANDGHLPRTPAQRRADALARIFEDAAGSKESPVPSGSVHTVVWSAEAFEEMVRRLDPNYRPVPFDPDTFRCETIDGDPLDPHDAFADALVSSFRRAVVDAKGVTIDLGRARLFTGGAKAAVQLSATTCVWPGCQLPTTRCQTDHLKPHGQGGRTSPGNGAVLCGRHNRLKATRNYRIWRDADGTWNTQTPDGRIIH